MSVSEQLLPWLQLQELIVDDVQVDAGAAQAQMQTLTLMQALL